MKSTTLIQLLGLSLVLALGGGIAYQTSALSRGDDPRVWSRDALRDHARETFRRLTRGDDPEWEDPKSGWKDQCDVDLMDGGCATPIPVTGPEAKPAPAQPVNGAKLQLGAAPFAKEFLNGLSLPVQLQITPPLPSSDSKAPTVTFPPVLQTIYFNRSAAATIERRHLNSSDALSRRLRQLESNEAPLSDMTIPDFSSDAVVIKSFWELLNPGQTMIPNEPNYATGALLYQRSMVPKGKIGTLVIPQLATNQEPYVDISDQDQCTHKSRPDKNGSKHDIFSIGCFHFRKVHPSDLDTAQKHNTPRADIHASNGTLKCNGQSTDCYLIMVGVHVMTRETPNWLWMTFFWSRDWWSDHPGETVVPNKWDLFEANATANNTDPVANPYLEGPTSGMYSNCLECHRHAVYREDQKNSLPGATDLAGRYFAGIAGADIGDQLAFTSTNPLPPDKIPSQMRDLHLRPCYFASALQTHFLWTIALADSKGLPSDPCPALDNQQPGLPKASTSAR